MCHTAESSISALPPASGAQCVEAAEALFRQKTTALIHNHAMHKLVSLIFESLSNLHREKQQVMNILCKDFNARAFFPTAAMLFHLYVSEITNFRRRHIIIHRRNSFHCWIFIHCQN